MGAACEEAPRQRADGAAAEPSEHRDLEAPGARGASRAVAEAPFAPVGGRDVAALQDPRPACIVGACAPDGQVALATVIWATPLSHTPPLVAFALRERSHTLGALRATGRGGRAGVGGGRATGRFSLSVAAATAEGARAVEQCGTASGHAGDKGALVAHDLVDGLPVPRACASYLLCSVEGIQEAGDHLLVIGAVEAAATRCGQRDPKGRLLPFETLLCVQHGAYGACAPL